MLPTNPEAVEKFADAIGSTKEEIQDALEVTTKLLNDSQNPISGMKKSDMINAIAATKFQEAVKINMALSLGMTLGIANVMGNASVIKLG